MADAATLHEEEALGKAYDARLMRRLLRYLRPYKWHVAGALLVLLLGSGIAIVGPWITQLVIDEAIPNADFDHFVQLCLIGAVIVAIMPVSVFGRSYLTKFALGKMLLDIRAALAEKLLRLPLL